MSELQSVTKILGRGDRFYFYVLQIKYIRIQERNKNMYIFCYVRAGLANPNGFTGHFDDA